MDLIVIPYRKRTSVGLQKHTKLVEQLPVCDTKSRNRNPDAHRHRECNTFILDASVSSFVR